MNNKVLGISASCFRKWMNDRTGRRMLSLAGLILALGATGIWALISIHPAVSAEATLDIQNIGAQKTVEHFIGLDKVEPFSHRRRPFEKVEGLEVEVPVDLGLEDTIDMALKNHLLSRSAREKIDEAIGRRWQFMSALLPHVEAGISQKRTGRENLVPMGFLNGGMIGPYNSFDARFQLMQKIIDLSAFSQFQAGRVDVQIAQYEDKLARQKVILLASLAYLEALRAYGGYQAAEADYKLAGRLMKQARHQHEAGIASGVDVARAETRFAEAKLRLEKSRTDVHETYLELQRVTGLSYYSAVRLMNSLCFIDESVPSIEEATVIAAENRVEMQIAQDRVRASQYRLYGAGAEALPTFEMTGDYGLSGLKPDHTARETGRVLFSINMPIFEGGLIKGKVQEALSQKRQMEIQYGDLKRQVEEDVHLAVWTIETSIEQVKAAGKVVALAQRELKLANHRFAEGVGDNVEVVNAQTILAQAENEYVAALSQYHTARMNLFFSLGKTESFYLQETLQPKE